MAVLDKVAAAIPGGGVRKYRGTVVTINGETLVNIDGQNLRATWADPIIVDDGDVVDVEVSGGAQGQSAVHVPSRTTLQPRPKTGTVSAVPSSSPTISVTAGGVTYAAEFIGTYAVGDKVHLDWGAGRPRVVGKVTTTAAGGVITAPSSPVAAVTTGTASAAARRSGTLWGPGGWESWAGGGEHVYQGNYGSGPLSGAWFYGSAFSSINDGRTITAVRFRTGRRRPVGASNDPVVFHFYAHTNSSRPAGDVSRAAGPFDVTIRPGEAPRWLNLPASWGSIIAAGGGIAVYGDGYAGMEGRLTQADSGALKLDWKKG